MTYALFACTLWMCAPEPLREGLRIEQCRALKVTMAVEGVKYRCFRRE